MSPNVDRCLVEGGSPIPVLIGAPLTAGYKSVKNRSMEGHGGNQRLT